jgi:hypothetical protein
LDLTTHTSLSPIRSGFAPGFVNYKKGCTRLAAASDKVYQFLAYGRWFPPGTPASSTTKTGRHDIAEIWINCMDCVFTPLLKWPSSAHVRKHMPLSFRMSFSKTTCVIDVLSSSLKNLNHQLHNHKPIAITSMRTHIQLL